MWSKLQEGERWIIEEGNRLHWEGILRDLFRDRVSAVGNQYKKEI